MIQTYLKWVAILSGGLVFGLGVGYFFFYAPLFAENQTLETLIEHSIDDKQVIGFLPYWLLSKAQTDYSPYINTLTYFGLTVDVDGSILKETAPTESEPGWFTLNSGKADPYLQSAKNKGVKLSLLIFAGKNDSINELVSDPITHANQLVSEVKPLMQKYHFTDLNLDIEATGESSDEVRANFGRFVSQVRKEMEREKLGTLTLELAPYMLTNKSLIDLNLVKDQVDYVVVMTYDYHYGGSQVSGPVAPIGGAGISSEIDVSRSTDIALEKIPAEKLILGVPLYGYQWETLRDATRSATIPSSGLSVSSKLVEEKLKDCTNCKVAKDLEAGESYYIYEDIATGTFYQGFFPDQDSTRAKIRLANQKKLGGLALWALGYENNDILNPLKGY